MKKNTKILLSVLSIFMVLMTLNSCREPEGCMNPDAVNYDIFAEVDDGSCTLANAIVRFQSTIDGSRVGGPSDSIGGFSANFESIEFSIAELMFTTEKETIAIPSANVLNIDSTYLIDELKVADLSGISFNINSMTMKGAIDVNGDEEYSDTEMIDLSCSFNATPIQIEADSQSVNSIDYEVNISFDLEKFFDDINVSTPSNISCPSNITNTDKLFYVK